MTDKKSCDHRSQLPGSSAIWNFDGVSKMDKNFNFCPLCGKSLKEKLTAEILRQKALALLKSAESKLLTGDPEETALADIEKAEELLNTRDEIIGEKL